MTHHGLTQYHAVVELLGSNTAIRLVFPRIGIATKIGMTLYAEPIECATHVHFLFCCHVEQGEVDSGATRVTALLGDIAQLEEPVTRHIWIEIGLHKRVVDISSPTHKMVDGTLRPVSVKYLQAIALFQEVVAHGTEAVGSLAGEQGDRFLIAVHASTNEIIGAVITYFQDGIGNDVGKVHKLAGIISGRQRPCQLLELSLGLAELLKESCVSV